MKFALVNGQRQEAQPNLSGKCPTYGHPMVAKCGEVKIWHWAHRGNRSCDPWWENETEWHRAWKGQFPVTWQEVVHQAENGEKHIADVKTDHGWVIEFQHSYIKPEERRTREAFYKKLVWVVDGTRRKRDKLQFINALKNGVQVVPKMNLFKIFSDESAILREWADSHAPVFFDFGEGPSLWWLLPKSSNEKRDYVAAFSRTDLIETHCGGATQMIRDFDELVKDFSKLVVDYELQLRPQALKQAPQGFQQYLARRRRRF